MEVTAASIVSAKLPGYRSLAGASVVAAFFCLDVRANPWVRPKIPQYFFILPTIWPK
jgi:hypothetical protein